MWVLGAVAALIISSITAQMSLLGGPAVAAPVDRQLSRTAAASGATALSEGSASPVKPGKKCRASRKDPGGHDPWGGCWPGGRNTGVRGGAALKQISGSITIKRNGAVVSGVDVAGCINVLGLNVTIKQSRAHCVTLPSGSRARYCHYGESAALRNLTECTVVRHVTNNPNPATNNPRLTLRDSVVDCHGTLGSTGIGDRNMNVIRVEVLGCENGFDADSYMGIRDSFIHNLHNSAAGDPHTDGLQSGVGAHLRIVHNVIYGFTDGCTYPNESGSCNGTSALIMGGQRGLATSRQTLIKRNLIAGGAYTLYCPIEPPSRFLIVENYFSTVYSPHVGEYGPTDACRRPGINSSGNKRLKYATGRVKNFRPS
jgi:hypothetical protein